MVANGLIKPIGLLIENIIQNKIGQVAYGEFASLNALAFIFSVVMDFGLNTYLIRTVQNENKHSDVELFSTALTIKSILALIFPFVMVLIGYLLSYNAYQLLFLFLISLSYSFFAGIQYLRAKLQATHNLNIDAFASISDRLFFIVITIITLLYFSIDLKAFIVTKTLSMFIAFLFVLFFAYKYLPKAYFNFSIDILKKKNVLAKSLPYALLTVLMSIHDKVDQIMIERMVGAYESGIYAAAYRWLDAFMVYMWVLLPIFYTKFCAYLSNRVELQKSFQLGQIIIFIPIIWVVVWIQFYGEYLFFLFDNASKLEIAKMNSVLSMLSIVLLIYSITTIYGTLITALAKEKYLIYISLFSIVLNIGLNIFLIPAYKSNGAALATIISSLVVGLVHLYKIYSKNELTLSFHLIIHFVIQFIGAIICFYISKSLDLSFTLMIIFAALFFLLLSFVTGLKKIINNQL